MLNNDWNAESILFTALIAAVVFIVMGIIWDFFSSRSHTQKYFESSKTNLIFNTINKHLEVVDYWFIDNESTRVNMKAEKLIIEYSKYSEPNKVIEQVLITGQVEFGKKFYNIEPLEIVFSQTEQALVDSDSMEVIKFLDSTLGLHEQIILRVSHKVNQGHFGLGIDVETF